MELTRERFRAIIFYNFRRKLSPQECLEELHLIFGDEAPSRTSVYRWYTEFKRGRTSLTDEFRKGRPKSVAVPENIDAVRELIKQDRHVTYREIEASLGISMTSINKILHNHLAAEKISSGWIPQKQEPTLAATNEQDTDDNHKDDNEEVRSEAKPNDEIEKPSTSSAASMKRHTAMSKVKIETRIETIDSSIAKHSRRKAVTEDPIATPPAFESPCVVKDEHTITEAPKRAIRTRNK